MLYMLSKFPTQEAKQGLALNKLTLDDTLLLMNDGVMWPVLESDMNNISCKVVALADDVKQRGVQERLPEAIKLIPFDEFVQLSAEYEKIMHIS